MHVKSKGSAGEREFCKVLEKRLGISAERNVDQVRDGGADIISVRPFAIEVKRQENLLIKQWWVQALGQRKKKNPVPVLAFRQNFKKWRVIMSASDLMLPEYAVKDQMVEISLDHFIYVVSRMLEEKRNKKNGKKKKK